jgi:sulfatase maturation enzyme AslB (radical SAM superfamily)
MNDTTPINKGNYSMDTEEREQLFEQYRAEGWEDDYKAYRQHWSEYPKRRFVADYPLLVDLEISSICNLKCPMCYTITDEFKKKVKTGLIKPELFFKIIDEIGGNVPALRLSLRGEPLLHKEIIRFVSYAKKKGIKEISFLTNLGKIDRVTFTELMQAGVDWITVSIDGVDEVYESIRKPLKFKETFEKIRYIREIKNTFNRHKPVIKVQAIWPSIRNNPEEYYNRLASEVDLIAFNPLIDYLGKDTDIVYLDQFSCPQHYQRLVIGADGLAMMCSNDEENSVVVGDAHVKSIYDIWHGDALNGMRALHSKPQGFLEIPVCKKCYLPRATEASEKARVNGREIIIENYINRNQRIGA